MESRALSDESKERETQAELSIPYVSERISNIEGDMKGRSPDSVVPWRSPRPRVAGGAVGTEART
jgi:hypothetical protein